MIIFMVSILLLQYVKTFVDKTRTVAVQRKIKVNGITSTKSKLPLRFIMFSLWGSLMKKVHFFNMTFWLYRGSTHIHMYMYRPHTTETQYMHT